MTVIQTLLGHAARDPERLAFDVAGRSLTRAQLLDGARRAAAGFVAAGVRPGDRVALTLGTSAELVCAFFGAGLVRAVPVALDTHLSEQAIARRVALVQPKMVVDPALASRLQTSEPPLPLVADDLPSPSELAFLQITSGTSGEPKAVMITHANVLASVIGSTEALGLGPDDVFASWMPIHHDLGLVDFVLLPTFAGLPCWLLPPSLTQIRPWLQLMSRVGATITGGPDFAYRLAARLADDGRTIDLSRLRVAISGGEPVRASTIEAFEARWSIPGRVRPGYGLAEATLGVSFVRPGEPLRVDARGHVSTGRAVPGVDLRVRDGQIEARGARIFAGYLGDPLATRAALSDDGWLRTGDSGVLDADGYLFVHGRERAMIKRAGAAIAPRELEEAAERVVGVRLAAAVGVPREVDGTEEIVVVVEVGPETACDAIGRAVEQEVLNATGYAPGRVIVAPPRTIPRTGNGKLRHAALRQTLEGQAATESMRWP